MRTATENSLNRSAGRRVNRERLCRFKCQQHSAKTFEKFQRRRILGASNSQLVTEGLESTPRDIREIGERALQSGRE